MEITITINGKPVQATVDDTVIREVMSEKTPEKMTGYERNRSHRLYHYANDDGTIAPSTDAYYDVDNKRYECGNYYSDETVVENNVRADNLMRNLRRFAAEHGGCGKPAIALCVPSKEFDWYIIYDNGNIRSKCGLPGAGAICFKDDNIANAAIDAFRDELTWYFAEYDPMPEGWWDQ